LQDNDWCIVEDPWIKAINGILANIYHRTIPESFVIKEDGSLERVYSKETQEMIDYWQSEKLKRLQEIIINNAKNLGQTNASA